uniref:SH3 domain-containing protein n=1 Tax=Mesocestoides corti TaxID=53468 RepID=A0A5K3FAJ4_MESCO
MSQTLDNSNNVGGKTSIKDKLSRRVRLTITKTGQKLKTSQKCINGSDYERLQDYHNKVRNQKEALRKLSDQWKRYLAKTEEIDKICYEFETDLVRFFNLYEKTNENIKKSTSHFPVISGVPFAAEIIESKRHLEKESKKIKTAEEHYSVYLASKNIFQKATELKKEREKQAMESAQMTFLEDMQNLDQTLPRAIEMSREKLYECMATYFGEKIQHLNMVLEETKNIQELIKDVGNLSSSPLSSSVPGSPGCSTIQTSLKSTKDRRAFAGFKQTAGRVLVLVTPGYSCERELTMS